MSAMQANRHSEAAKLLVDLAKQAAAAKIHPLRVKKLYVLAALEVRPAVRARWLSMFNRRAARSLLLFGMV
jgi:WD repeat-containing protein 35